MKKSVKIASIVAGSLFLGNTLLMSVIANFNIGLVPVALLGVVLLVYGIFLDKLPFRKVISTLLAVGLSVIIVFASFLAIYGRNDNATYNEKTVIVLGCGIRGERVSVGLAKRLNKAYEYHLQNPEATIIVSGGQGPQEEISEALVMKRYLVSKGVPEDRIIMEDKSTSTITNFKFSHEIMKENNITDICSHGVITVVRKSFNIHKCRTGHKNTLRYSRKYCRSYFLYSGYTRRCDYPNC